MDWTTLMLLAIAVLNAYTAWAALQTRSDIRTLEKNTNSIKDALVKATGDAAHGAGLEQGRAEGKMSANELAAAKRK